MVPKAYDDLLKRTEMGNLTIFNLKTELAACTDRSVRVKLLVKLWESLAVEEDRQIISDVLRQCEADLVKAMKTPA